MWWWWWWRWWRPASAVRAPLPCSAQLAVAALVGLASLVCLLLYLRRRMADMKPKALRGESEMLERNELFLCRPAHVSMNTCLQPKNAKLPSKPNQGSSGALKTGNMVERGVSAKLQPEGKERQQEVRELDMKPLMIEEDAIDRLELNLKHKAITYFWGITTPLEESTILLISKSPPDPPASGDPIENVVREITFIDSEVKQRLEWHVVWKKLQHNWDYPVPIQISQEAFIPSAPKLNEFQLKSRLALPIVHVPAEPVFLPDGHPEAHKLHIKKSNKNCKPGLPKSSQISVSHFIPADPQRTGVIIQPQKQSMSAITVSPKCKDRLKSRSKKQCHDINMLYRLPDVAPKFCATAFNSISTNTLPNLIEPGKEFTKSRSLYVPFIEQAAVDRLELNLKHKQILQLRGLENLHEESLKLMISQEQCILPTKIIINKMGVPRALKSYFVSNYTRFLLEWHIKQRRLEHNWNVPSHILGSQQEFIPRAPKLIVSQLKPQPDFDLNIIPIELAFLCAESKKKLELYVKKKVINYLSGLPQFVRLSLENFSSCAPSICFVKSQLGTEKNVSQVNSKFKTTCLPSRLLQPKGGKLTVHRCKQVMTLVQSSEKNILPMFACLKFESKDKLEMCLIKQHLNIKLYNLPSNVQESYENVYPPEPKISLSTFLITGKSRKKTRPRYIPFFENDALDRLEKNLRKKLSAHILGFQTMFEESMEIMIPKTPPVLPAIKASRSQIEAVPMETLFLSRDIRDELEWHIIKTKLQNRGLPFYYQNAVETFIPPAPHLALSQLNPQADFSVLIVPCELSSAHVEIGKKIEFNIQKKLVNRIWGVPNIVQLSLKKFIGPAPSVNIVKSSKPMLSNKNAKIRQTKYLQKMFVLSAPSEREKRESKLKSGNEIIFSYLKEKDKDKLDHCLMKQLLEIRMYSLPEMLMKFYKMNYLPKSKRSFSRLIAPKNGIKKTRALFLSFIEQYVVDQLELNLKHKQINNFWGVATLSDESLGLMICSGPPAPLTVKASRTQTEPVSREIYITAEVQKDLNVHVTLKKLQQNWSVPLHVQESVNAFIPSAPKPVLSNKHPQPDFLIFSQSELTFLHKECKRRLEFNVRKRIVNRQWGFPNIVVSSWHNFMAGAPSLKDLILQCEITKNKRFMADTSVKKRRMNDAFPLQVHGSHLLPQNERASNNKKASNKIVAFSSLKVDQDKLNICVTKQSLEIKMHSLSELVTLSYQNTYTTPSKASLPRLIASREERKKPRSILFIEQEVVDHLELNLKHKQILHLWASETHHEISVKMLIPKGPNVYPVVGSEGIQIEPIGMETAFIEVGTQNILEWHIIQKNLESNWHLPLNIQTSIDMHIPSAPKLVPSQLKRHCFYAAGIISAELLFMGFEGRKRLERNIKKKIINQRCGLPTLILSSLKEFLGLTFSNADVEFNSKMVMRHKEGMLLSVTGVNVSKEVGIRKINQFPEFAILENEFKYKLNVCLLKQILNARMHFLPYFARESYNKFKPSLSVKKLLCTLFVSKGVIKQRPRYLPFVEQRAIGDLELNLKQKQMIHLWKFETLYEKSMEIMIPKGPLVHPAIKASGAKIVHVCMEKAVEYDIRNRLNRHITQRKLQQNYDFPLHIQLSTEFFIQPAPKLIPSQLNPKPCFEVVVVPNELTFLCKEHQKLLELNTKKKIINHKCGPPTLIQSSLKNFVGPNGLSNQVMFMVARNTEVNDSILPNKFGIPLQYRKDNKEIEKIGNDLFYVSQNPDWKHILETCIIKMSLEIKIGCCPAIVTKFYTSTYPTQLRKPLPKLTVPGGGFKRRQCYLFFVEQSSVDHLELNLKHKHIIHLWKVKNLYEESKEIMISEPVMPTAKGSRAPKYPVNLETIFIEDEVIAKLQWHITQKKLQLNFGLSLHIQKSQEEFIQSAPKLIPSWVKERPVFTLFHSAELFFLSPNDRKCLEMMTRKRIICYKWGLPKAVQHSMNRFMALIPVHSEVTEENAPSLCSTHSGKGIMSICLQTKNAKLSSKQDQRYSGVMAERSVFNKLQLEWKEKLESCLIKQCLDIKMCFLPDMVCKLYETTVSKKLLPKPILSGKGARKPRSLYIDFIEQNAVDWLELNLKHKTIVYLWGIKTPFEKSVTLMIPKPPPEPPAFRKRGAEVEDVVTEMISIDSEIKERLEWHIVRKKVQHNWGYPVHIQISQETFIPVTSKLFQPKPWFSLATVQHKTTERLEWKMTQKNLQYSWGLPKHTQISSDALFPLVPKLNLSQLFSKPDLDVPSETAFLSDEGIEILNQNVKKKIINHKWGLPKVVYSSFIQFMGTIPMDFLPSNGTNEANMIYNNLDQNYEVTTQSTKAEITTHELEELFSNLHLSPEGKHNVNMCLTKQSLEMKMDCIPKFIKDSFNIVYSLALKRELTKVIVPNIRFKRKRSYFIPFVEQDVVVTIEKNLKHRQILFLWGLKTLYEKSIEIMIPKGPPLPPQIKTDKAKIKAIGEAASSFSEKVTKLLEWHIDQKKFQHVWGSLPYLKKSVKTLIPPAPKLIVSQLHPQLSFEIEFTPGELAFINNEDKNALEINIKKRIVNQGLGLPKVIEPSFNEFMGPSPIVDEICSSPAIKLTSFPLTIQEHLISNLTQQADSVRLTSYTNDDECIRNNEPCLEQLTEESKINIQQDAYVKVTTKAFKSQNEKRNNQVELSEMMICDSLGEKRGITSQISDGGNYFRISDEQLGGTCYESLNHSSRIHMMKKKCRKKHCFSNQTKVDQTLVKPKTKLFRQSPERQKVINYEEKNAELIRQDIVFVGPTGELQSTAVDQKSLTHEMSGNRKGNLHSSQGSTLHSTGCQVLPSEHSPFARYKDFEGTEWSGGKVL